MYAIYRIRSEVNGKSYIGYTIENPPKKRMGRHIQSTRRGSETHLHRAMRKDGIDNFSFEILCWGEDHEAGLKIAEPLMIELFPHEYNMTKGGEGTLGRVHTEVTKEKLRIAQTGKKRLPESLAKQSAKTKGVPRGPHSVERRRNISLAKMGFKHSIESREHMRLAAVEHGRKKRERT